MRKKLISLFLSCIFSLSACFVGCSTQNSNSDNESLWEDSNRVVTEYGAELNRQFKLPKEIVNSGGLTLTKLNGETTNLAFDNEGKIVFDEIGDYNLSYNGGYIKIYVRDTLQPVFSKVVQEVYALVGVRYDLSKLAQATDNSGSVTYTYKVEFLSAIETELVDANTFVPDKIGYYSVKTTAKDASGNEFSVSSRINTITTEECEVAFFNNKVVPISGNMLGTGYSKENEPKMGDIGSSLKLNCGVSDNYASIVSGKDLSNVNDIYYYVYFDSASFKDKDGNPLTNLPQLIPEILPVPNNGTHSVWTANVCSADVYLKYNTWILVKATLTEGKANLTDTLKFHAPNYKGNWVPDSWDWTQEGYYRYTIYIDNVMIPKAHSENEIAYFDDIDAIAKRNGAPVGLSQDIRMGNSGKSLYVNATENDNYVITSSCQDLNELSEVYYYVYFDSNSFVDASGNKVTKLPKLNLSVFPTLMMKNPTNGWPIQIPTMKLTNFDPLEYDTWIRVIATFEKGSLQGKDITFYLSNYKGSWVPESLDWTASGYKYKVYIDTIYKGTPGWTPWVE